MSLTPWHQAEECPWSCPAPLPRQLCRGSFPLCTREANGQAERTQSCSVGNLAGPCCAERGPGSSLGGKNKLLQLKGIAGSTALLCSHLVPKLAAAPWAVFSLSWFGEKHLVPLTQTEVSGGVLSCCFKGVCLSRDGRRWERYRVMPMANGAVVALARQSFLVEDFQI